MTDFCYFYRNNGNVVYNDIDLSTNLYVFHDKIKSEMISAKDIYISSGKRIFHKTNSIMLNSESVRFLEWKLTKSGEWDWFLVNGVPSNIKCIINKSDKKIDINSIKQELLIVLNKYNISELSNNINDMIDDYYKNKI